jgi:nicotinate phosphoribosyltransferase
MITLRICWSTSSQTESCVYELPSIHQIRQRTLEQLAAFPENVTALQSPSEFPVGLEENLYLLKMDLIQKAKAQ